MNKQDAVKQEIKDVRRNYTRTPNILFESYPDLRPQEKWLYINLVYLCGARGTRHLSLRYIHDRTGISLGALSGSKDPAKNDLGMIRRLHNAGLIHAEIKKKKTREGKESDQAQYHITIVDLWQLNESFFHERSENEHFQDETLTGVQNPNASVRKMNALNDRCSENERERSENERERSENERERSENDTNIRLHSKTTESKTTEKDNNDGDADAITTSHSPLSLSAKKQNEEKPTTPPTTEQCVTPPTPKEPAPPAPAKPAKGTRAPSTLSKEGQHIQELWETCTKRKISLTPANIKGLNGLGEVVASDEDFNDAFKMMKENKFYKDNGVRIDIDFMFRKYDGWIDKVYEARNQAKAAEKCAQAASQANAPRQLTDLEKRQREMAAKYMKKAN